MTFVDILKFGFAVIFANLGSAVNGKITRDNLKWFATLKKPAFNPPGYLFGPVWITLYTLMGVASYLVYRDGGGFCTEKSRIPLLLYGIQLTLNWAWTPIFFGNHDLKWSFVEGLFLLGAIVACAISFYRVNRAAGWLFAPYILWATFASYLNYSLYRLNPEVEGMETTTYR